MLRRFLSLVALLLMPNWAFAQTKPVDFNRDIKPILSNNCYFCHGPDADERKGGQAGLRLDTPEGAVEDLGDGSRAIVPGHPETSVLIARINSHDPDDLMPPAKIGKKLTPRDRELLTTWIKQGAAFSQHWSYVKPVRPVLPTTKNTTWARNEVDRFLLARLEREGLTPAPEADRYTLARRLALDLTGLPPTLAEVDAFVADTDPQAYERLVDRLLATPAYGEYWAQLWLDLARYADSTGYADDKPRTIWLYRDWVIRALNANMPFDRFTIEQIAGDLLPNPTQDQLIATAFHRNTLTNNEGGTNDEEYRNVAVVDRVNTTLAVWMGTTIACAQCHTHKFDPLSQEEYFQLFAMFNNSEDADRGDESPLLSFYTTEQQQQRDAWQAELAKLDATLRTPTPALAAGQTKWEENFPREIGWQPLKPTTVVSTAKAQTTIADDGSVLVAAGAKTDSYRLTLPAVEGKLRGLRLEALADDTLPGKGPGHAGGNFVVSRVAATFTPPAEQAPLVRYVRVEIPGKQKILSLAEVQVLRDGDNLALKGEASQSSTAFEGPARLAIDGKTDGDYKLQSTTHTATSDNPWWEVDLIAGERIDRIVLWNRTDGGVGERLRDFRIVALNDRRERVWEQQVSQPPSPSAEFSPSGARNIEFSSAVADYSQAGYEAATLPNNKDLKQKGWAVGGETGRSHALLLVAKQSHDIPPGSQLTVTIDHATGMNAHTLGRFRLSTTDDARAAEFSRTPAAIVTALKVATEERTPQQLEALAQHYRNIAPELAKPRQEAEKLRKQIADQMKTTVPIMRELASDKQRVTKIQHRGNFMDLGKEVTAGTPAVFPPLPDGAPRNRLSLARWLVAENNPLTARVVANRYWEQIFGTGIVSTSEEFGAQGDQPFHPELLDWLATEMTRLGWDTKAFLRLLVTSAAYRQSSRVTPELQQRDPENRLLATGPRLRLQAETVRDQALAVSGLLSAKLYGLPVKPPQPTVGLNAAFGGAIDWQTSAGEDRYRRALYTSWRRSNPYPSMTTFDAPNREVCTLRRGRTNTPLQALVTMNDPVYIEAAQALARRTMKEGGSNTPERMRHLFRLCLARPPHEAEAARLTRLYEQSHTRFAADAEAAKKLATEPLGPAPADMNLAELAAWTVVANVVLNLDETLMKR